MQTLVPAAGDLAAFVGMNGVTPLMAAASGGHNAMVELLLLRGSNPARRDVNGRSAAGYARATGHPHLAGQLDSMVDLEATLR
jgi:ankyrin repeat protein